MFDKLKEHPDAAAMGATGIASLLYAPIQDYVTRKQGFGIPARMVSGLLLSGPSAGLLALAYNKLHSNKNKKNK